MEIQCLKCGVKVDFGPVSTHAAAMSAQTVFGQKHQNCGPRTAYLSEVLRIIRHGREGNVEGLEAYARLLADKLKADGENEAAERVRRFAGGDYGAVLRLQSEVETFECEWCKEADLAPDEYTHPVSELDEALSEQSLKVCKECAWNDKDDEIRAKCDESLWEPEMEPDEDDLDYTPPDYDL